MQISIKLITYKKEIQKFIRFLTNKKSRKVNFILIGLSFLILPSQNNYANLKIPLGRPVVREVDYKLPEVSLYPVNKTLKKAPFLTAFSALVIDADSKTVIFAKNPDIEMIPASTTKIMTALVALDTWRLNDILEVKSQDYIGQTIKLEIGEKITFENLLYGLLVQSGNDAAIALAENYQGGLLEFVKAMNIKAKELNLENTHFANPTGIEEDGHLTTAHDLAILASMAMENEIFAKMVSTPSITVADVSGTIQHKLENINQLLGKIPGLKGVKTGWTINAGECLVGYTEREKGKIITVVLGSQDRFGETKQLIDWVYDNFSWETL